MPEGKHRSYVVVGVVPGQADDVVLQAAAVAGSFGATLVCAHVDTGRYVVEERADGSVSSLPFDPDLPELTAEDLDPALTAHLSGLLDELGIRWETRALAGETAAALGRLAEHLDAVMIVVGTSEPSVRASLQDFFSGSVAVHLAHRQHRPVLVVPLHPVGLDRDLPWQKHSKR